MKQKINHLELWHDKKHSWFAEPTDGNLKTDDIIKIEAMYSLVSLGTERLVTTQNIPDFLASKMSVPYMKGHLSSEFTYGYSLVGRVVDGPTAILNRLVHVLHPHQNVAFVKSEDLSFIPNDIDPYLATLASNMETAVNAIWDGQIEIGDKILVMGYGVIGALIAAIAKSIVGVEVVIIEKEDRRRKTAISQGLKIYDEVNPKNEFDVVFNTTCNENMLQLGLECCRVEGKVIELSWYGSRQIKIDLGSDFHYGRKRIISSQVSIIPYHKQPIWNFKSRKDLVFRLLKILNPTHLFQSEINFNDTPKFYDALRKGQIDDIGVQIKY